MEAFALLQRGGRISTHRDPAATARRRYVRHSQARGVPPRAGPTRFFILASCPAGFFYTSKKTPREMTIFGGPIFPLAVACPAPAADRQRGPHAGGPPRPPPPPHPLRRPRAQATRLPSGNPPEPLWVRETPRTLAVSIITLSTGLHVFCVV